MKGGAGSGGSGGGGERGWRAVKHRLQRQADRGVAFITKHTGYTADHLRAGVQLAVGLLLMLASFGWPAAWNKLTLKSANITPVYAIVTFCVVLQPNLGTASQFVIMRAVGAVVGGLCGLVCMYVTYWINGSSYERSATKGAVMVTLLSALSFVLGLYRFRLPRWWFAFCVATFSMPMVALNPYHLDYVEYKALWYWWLQIAIGIGVAALCSTFVFPITAGHKVQVKTAEAMRKLASLTSATVRHMTSMPIDEEGLAQGVTGTLDGLNAVDTGLAGAFKPLYDTALQVSTSISQTRALLLVVGTEWNAYSSSHVFPREAYQILVYIIRAYLSSVMALLYPLQSGRLALRAVHKMGPEFQKAADLLAACLQRAADCIQHGADYTEALASLRALEERWHLLGGLCPAIGSSWGENEVLTSDMLVGTLFSLGTRVRRIFFTLPEALHRSQPGARQECYKHFKGSRVWDLSLPQEQLRQRARLRAMTPRVADLDATLPSPRSLAASPRKGGPAGQPQPLSPAKRPQSPPQSPPQPLSPAARQVLPSPRREPRSLFGAWRQLSPAARKIFSWGRLPSDPAASAKRDVEEALHAVHAQQAENGELVPAAAAAGQGAHANGAAAAAAGGDGDERGQWHHVPSRSGRLNLQEEALFQPPDAVVLKARFPPTIHLPPPPSAGRLGRLRAALHDATGFTSEHAALALQSAAAMAAACTLHVVKESYEALHERTIWIVVTVAVILESAVGGLVLKSGLRVLGTSTAGLLGVGLIGLAVVCNGGDYTNSPAKFIAMAAFLPTVAFLLMINHVRFITPYGYFWSCSKFTLPIIALAGYVAESVQWLTACWRLANILIGIGLDLAASTLVLPVTSRQATRHRIQEVLGGLAELSEAVLLEFVGEGAPAEQPPPDAASGGPSSGGSTPHASGATPPGRRSLSTPRRRVPRTPLSTSEAYEVTVAAQARASEAREARRELQSLQRWQSGGSPAGSPTARDGGSQVGASPRATPLSAAGFLRRHFLPSPRAAWRSGSPPASRTLSRAHSARSSGAGSGVGAGGAAGDLELGAVQPPLDGQLAEVWAATVPPPSWGGAAARAGDASSAAASSPDQQPQQAGGTPGAQARPARPPLAPRMPPLSLPPGAVPPSSPLPPPSPFHQASPTAQPPALELEPAPGPPSPPSKAPSPSLRSSPPKSTSLPARLPAGVRRPMSLPPDLPTVVSQQVLHDEQLPSLPPLHIPLHHVVSNAEEGGRQLPPGSAASTASMMSPFGAAAAAQQGATPAAGQRPGGEGEQGRGRRDFLGRRPSTSSTVFYQGTPRNPLARRDRTRWLVERALGRSFVKVRGLGAELAATIGHMHELALFARFEWVPYQRPHSMAPKDILAAQHACRKLLNVLLSFAYLADAPDVPHHKLLMPMPREVRAVAEQMGEALRALSLVLDKQLPVERALEMVFNLQLQVQLLLLEVEQAGEALADATQADAVLGVAAMGVMFSATQTVQLLYRCVLRLLGSPEEHAAAEDAFAQSAAWGASVEAILVARGVVLSAAVGTDSEEVGGLSQAAAEAEGAGDAEALATMRGD